MATPADPWTELRRHTPARIALGRAGGSLPTSEVLAFAAAHAQARDAVHLALDVPALTAALHADGWETMTATSQAVDRSVYLRRPDLGRRLDAASVTRLGDSAKAAANAGENATTTSTTDAPANAAGDLAPVAGEMPDVALVVADGLSALAAQQHALETLSHLRIALGGALRLSPVVVATQARVALADEVGALLGARAVLILLGERPGLSSPDSLGAYLTYAPQRGRSDAQRNCVSNIRPAGLHPAAAGARIAWMLREALRRGLSGVALKDDSAGILLDAGKPG